MKKTAEILKDAPITEKTSEFSLRSGKNVWSFFDKEVETQPEIPKTWMSYLNDNKYVIIAATLATGVIIAFTIYPDASNAAANSVYTLISGYVAGKSVSGSSDPKSSIFDAEKYELGKTSNNTPKDISVNDERTKDIVPEATKVLETNAENGSTTPKALKTTHGARSPDTDEWEKQAEELKAMKGEKKIY
jgi:hypothetical protein